MIFAYNNNNNNNNVFIFYNNYKLILGLTVI